MTQVIDLGLVQALHVGPTPPLNKKLLWNDTTITNGSPFKYFNRTTLSWDSLDASTIADTNLANTDLSQTAPHRIYALNGNRLSFTGGQVTIGSGLASNYAFEINNTTSFAGGLLANGAALGVRGMGSSIGGLFEGTIGVQAYSSSGPAVQGISQGGGVAGFFQGGGYFETYGLGGSKDASALVHLRSTNSGFLIPEMSTIEKQSISTPAIGLAVIDSDFNREEKYNGSYWAGAPQCINIVSAPITTLTSGLNFFFGNTGTPPTSVALDRAFTSPISGIIRKAFIRSFANTAGDRSIDIYIRINNTTDYLIATVNTAVANREFINTSLNIPIIENVDTIVYYAVASGGTTDSIGVSFGGQLIIE